MSVSLLKASRLCTRPAAHTPTPVCARPASRTPPTARAAPCWQPSGCRGCVLGSVLAPGQAQQRREFAARSHSSAFMQDPVFSSLQSKEDDGLAADVSDGLSSWLDDLPISGTPEGNTITYSPLPSPTVPDRRQHLSLSGSLEGLLDSMQQRPSFQRSSTEWLHPHDAFAQLQQQQQQQPLFAPGWSVDQSSPSHSMDWQPQQSHTDEMQHRANSLSAPASALARSSSSSGSSSYSGSSSRSLEDFFCLNCTRPIASAMASCTTCGHSAAHPIPGASSVATAAAGTEPGPTAYPAHSPSAEGGNPEGVTLLGYDPRMLEHYEPVLPGWPEHVERPARVTTIMELLKSKGLLDRCMQVDGVEASSTQLEAVHEHDLIWLVRSASSFAKHRARKAEQKKGVGMLPSDYDDDDFAEIRFMISRYIRDCPVNSATYSAARLAAGTAARVAEAVTKREVLNGAAIVRPPGHHAETSLAMGFCLFNNAAVAARAAQEVGASRVLIMDWDIHHGNGTQDIFYDNGSVMYSSIHRFDGGTYFPGTGSARKVGSGFGEGKNVNVPWDGPGVEDGDYMAAFEHVILPIAKEFKPDLVIVSAGFDATTGDPLGGCLVTPAAFGHMTQMLSTVGPIMLVLEGGYNLSATAQCTEQCMRVLLGETPPPLASDLFLSDQGKEGIIEALQAQAPYWQSARERLEALSRSWGLQ